MGVPVGRLGRVEAGRADVDVRAAEEPRVRGGLEPEAGPERRERGRDAVEAFLRQAEAEGVMGGSDAGASATAGAARSAVS